MLANTDFAYDEMFIKADSCSSVYDKIEIYDIIA